MRAGWDRLGRVDNSDAAKAWVGRARQLAAAAIGLVVVVAVILALTLGGTAKSSGRTGGTAASVAQPLAPVSATAAELAKLPRATTYANIPAAPRDPSPFAITDGLVVHPMSPRVIYAGPGKQPVAVLPTTELGGPTWVPVVESTLGWERVLLPNRPNGASGWIYTAAAARSQLETRSSSYLVRINLGARKLSLYEGGQSRGTWTVAVGTRSTPTPTGRTFLLALLAPPHPTFSPLILPLGFHSNTLTTFGGGPGTVGVHGWPNPSVFGRAVSHGCVRVPTAALHLLSRVPLGSLVVITS